MRRDGLGSCRGHHVRCACSVLRLARTASWSSAAIRQRCGSAHYCRACVPSGGPPN